MSAKHPPSRSTIGRKKRILKAKNALSKNPASVASERHYRENPVPLNLSCVPTVIAHALDEYRRETHNPVLALWHMCDSIELLLRLIVIVGVNEMKQLKKLDTSLLSKIQPLIETPSMGMWRSMAEAVLRQLGNNSQLMPEAEHFLEKTLLPLLDGPKGKKADPATALSALRNNLAHGGGMSFVIATKLLRGWRPRFGKMLKELSWLCHVTLVARRESGECIALRGPSVKPPLYEAHDVTMSAIVDRLCARAGSVVAVRDSLTVPLWPCALFDVPRFESADAPHCTQEVPQIYARRNETNLDLTPIGSEEACHSEANQNALTAFIELFALDKPQHSEKRTSYNIKDFEEELRKDAGKLIGRDAELRIISETLENAKNGVLWIFGPAGIGKSYLMARVAVEQLDNASEETIVLPYRFMTGDYRCSRDVFLTFVLERLCLQQPAHEENMDIGDANAGNMKKEKSTSQLKLVDKLRQLLTHNNHRRILFILDGLDEIAERDVRFATEVLMTLGGKNVVWLCAGRAEHELGEVFAADRCTHVFPNGLPGMTENDVRGMLLERIGPLRKRVIEQDSKDGDDIVNVFVQRVVKYAQGLPIYVNCVIGDIYNNKYTALNAGDAARLPKSLEKYYEELLRRCAVSTLGQVMTPLAALLAVAEEPITPDAAVDLLHRANILPRSEGRDMISRALTALGSIVRRTTTPDGQDGYCLYHQSLRKHMQHNKDTIGVLETARIILYRAALDPLGKSMDCMIASETANGRVPAAASYLYRQGINHCLNVAHDEDLKRKSIGLLTSFTYLMDRLKVLGGDGPTVHAIEQDWRKCEAILQLSKLEWIWRTFWRLHVDILQRGDKIWPAHKILLQIAAEYADDSPVTKAAEQWIADGNCDWVWLRQTTRTQHGTVSPCLRCVLVGHTAHIIGAMALPDNRILSWSGDNTLRLWSKEGDLLRVLEGHTASIEGAMILPDDRILSWSDDHSLRLWSAEGDLLRVLVGHTKSIRGALTLPDARILSWSFDNTLRLWSLMGEPLKVLEGHEESVIGAAIAGHNRILSWSYDGSLRLWSADGEPFKVLAKHCKAVSSALVLANDRILSCSDDSTLHIWDDEGESITVLEGHTEWLRGAIILSDGCILSWSNDLRMWDSEGNLLKVFDRHNANINKAYALSDGRILSHSEEGAVHLWSAKGELLKVLEWQSSPISGIVVLPDDRILSWTCDGTILMWNSDGEILRMIGSTYNIDDALLLPNYHLLTWNFGLMCNTNMQLWDLNGESTQVADCEAEVLHGKGSFAAGYILNMDNMLLGIKEGKTIKAKELAPRISDLLLADGCLLTGIEGNTMRLLNINGEVIKVLEGHTDTINGVVELSDGRILSWSRDHTMRLWSGKGDPIKAIKGHEDAVLGAFELSNGNIVSCSADNSILLWTSNGEMLMVLEEHTDSIKYVDVLPDGRFLTVEKHKMVLWNDQGVKIRVYESKDENTLAFVIPDGRILSLSHRNVPRILNTDGERVEGERGLSLSQFPLSVLSNGRIVSWFGKGISTKRNLTALQLFGRMYSINILRLWSADGQLLKTLKGHTDKINGATELCDGRILSWSDDKTARLWSADGEPLKVLEGHINGVVVAEALPGGLIITSSLDHTMRVWNTQGESLMVIDGYNEVVECVDVLSDGRIVTRSSNGKLKMWSAKIEPLNEVIPIGELKCFPKLCMSLSYAACNIEVQDASILRCDSHVVLLDRESIDTICRWHSRNICNAERLQKDGQIVIRKELNTLVLVKLHCGATPITLTELRNLRRNIMECSRSAMNVL